ncbi:MAG TPA: oligosaccharide flippase family protein [Chloroflexota bacterium]
MSESALSLDQSVPTQLADRHARDGKPEHPEVGSVNSGNKESSPSGGAATLALASYLAQATRFGLSVLVAQVFGPAGRGAVALISVLDEASTTLFTAGVPPAAGYHAKTGKDSDAALMSAALRFGLLAFPVTAAIAVAIGFLGLGSLEPAARWFTVLLIAWTGIVNLPSLVAMSIMQAHRDLRSLAIYNMLFGMVTLIVVAALFLFGHLSIAWVAAGFVAGRLATAIYGAAKTALPRLRGTATLRPLLHYGLRALPGTTGMLLNNRLDQLLIAPLVDLRALGLYAVGAGTSFLPTVLAMSVASSAFSSITHDGHLGRRGKASMAIRRGLMVSGLSAVALAFLSPLLIPLVYGAAFKGAVVPTIVLLLSSVPWGGQIVARQCANALGYPGFGSAGEVTGLLVTGVGLLIFVPMYGILGAAVVSLAAYSVRFAVTVVLLKGKGVTGIIPGRDDLVWLWHRVTNSLRRRVHVRCG